MDFPTPVPFIKPNGSSLLFRIGASVQDPIETTRLIMEMGGQVTQMIAVNVPTDFIVIDFDFVGGLELDSRKAISHKFIQDCYTLRNFLDPATYMWRNCTSAVTILGVPEEIAQQSRVRLPPVVEETSSLPRTSLQPGQRIRFTEEDNRRMIAFAAENESLHALKGQKLWREAESINLTLHSWQSMSNHWKKKLHDVYLLHNREYPVGGIARPRRKRLTLTEKLRDSTMLLHKLTGADIPLVIHTLHILSCNGELALKYLRGEDMLGVLPWCSAEDDLLRGTNVPPDRTQNEIRERCQYLQLLVFV